MRKERSGSECHNNQGCLMKIINYNKCEDIIVEFQDEHKAKVHTNYSAFLKGEVKNPYYPSVLGVGMIGVCYPVSVNRKSTKEYQTWRDMLVRCFDKKLKDKRHTYMDVTCCKEWLLYENFYEWLHSQSNFDKWYNGYKWNLDKDILVKKNKIYSPETCCLVPHNVNSLFIKSDAVRGDLPIGVIKKDGKFVARCAIQDLNKRKYLGDYETSEEAFFAYKIYKEELIKQVAENEYNQGNITNKCYNAMINYEVEIND